MADISIIAEEARLTDGHARLGVAAVAHLRRGEHGVLVGQVRGELQHVSRAVETEHGLAVVDTTFGDLRVGPVLVEQVDDVGTQPPQ